jgi:hypothetical protein
VPYEEHHRLPSFPEWFRERLQLFAKEELVFLSRCSRRLAGEIEFVRHLRAAVERAEAQAAGSNMVVRTIAPQIPKRSAFAAVMLVYSFLALALLLSPFWLSAFLLVALKRKMKSAPQGRGKKAGRLALLFS